MKPKFSICIPTRNRFGLVADAVKSVLDSQYSDYEIIIADNSDNEPPYHWEFADNNEVKVLWKGGDIAPWDNWKRAAAAAKGEWVIMMPDKCVIHEDTLITLHRFIDHSRISQLNATVINWRIKFSETFTDNDDYNIMGLSNRSYRINTLDYKEVVGKLLNFSFYDNDYFPHGMNCCYKRFLGHENMYKSFCADYNQGMELIVNQKKSVSFIDLPLMRIPRLSKLEHSTGASLERGLDNAATRQYLKFFPLDQKEKMVENMPIKDFNFQTNVILYDLMNAAGSKEFISLFNLTNYRAAYYRYVLEKWLNTKKITYIGGPIDWAAMGIFIKRFVRDVGNRLKTR